MAVRTRTFSICAALIFAVVFSLGACGGDDDGGVTVIDAPLPIDAPADAAIDAFVCNPPMMTCAGQCVSVVDNNEFCGNCNTACSGGEVCMGTTCDCAPPFVPANPAGFSMMTEQFGFTIGILAYADTVTNVLVGAINASIVENMDYTLTGEFTSPPFLAAGYDVDIGSQTAAAAFVATAGTINFTKICPATAPNGAGFSGTATSVTFVAVEGLMNPTPVPGGCTFDVPSITFSFGDVTCTNQ